MAMPESTIWGAPESWIYAKNFYFVGTGSAETKTEKPKTAAFTTNDGTLAAGNTAGKTRINTDIDLTVCPCGQDPAASALGSIALFRNKQTVAGNKEPYFEIVRKQPCNWCLFDGTGVGLSTTYGHQRDRTNSQQRWVPDADINNNWNRLVSPFVYWQLKSILIKIEVGCITRYLGNDIPDVTWRSLNDWRQNYSSQKILDVRLKFCGISSTAGTNITYTSNSSMDTGDIGGVAILDSLADVTDYAAFGTARETTFYLIGHKISGNYYDEASTFYMCAYNMLRDTELKALSSSSTEIGWCLWSETPYSAENYDLIMSMVSCFGIPFTDKDKSTFPQTFNDPDLYLPIIDDDGITHGEYTHGEDNLDNDLIDADSIRDKTYDPAKPVDPNRYSDTTVWNTVNFQNSMCKRYQLTAAQVGELAGELWDMMAAIPAGQTQQDYTLDECLTNNPIDTIVSLKYFPCVVETAANPAVVHLGKYQTNISCQAVGTSVKVLDFEPIQLWRHFKDFRDFEPYTTLQMYIPFCGVVSIPTAEAMGRYVGVKLCIDVGTGACCGYVIVSQSGSGGICVATAAGTAAIDMPVSGLQSANLSQAIFDATANWTNTQISNGKIMAGVLQGVSGGTHGITGTVPLFYKLGIGVSDLLSARTAAGAAGIFDKLNPMKWGTNRLKEAQEEKRAQYDLTHIEMPMRLIGSTSPVLSSVIESQCRLIIYRPVTDESALAQYADTVGFATVSSGTVSQYSGFTTGTIDVKGINATAEEKEAIAAAFASGVYL